MDAKRRILSHLEKRRSASGAELRERLGISRQALNVHVRGLIRSGDVYKSGTTRGARYSLRTGDEPQRALQRTLPLKGLDEAHVYEQLAAALSLERELRKNVLSIAEYAFTEMLNNAVEHSRSERCRIGVRLDPAAIRFEIRDAGIGVFHSIAAKLRLPDEHEALLELLKGRTTTMREAHSGEGIFFTSRAVDRFVLRSHRIAFEANRIMDDVFVRKARFLKGTLVQLSLERATRRRLEAVFGEFAPAEFGFEFQRTRLFVKLLRRDYVSRSEAKRLLANVERFREVILDFRQVQSIGQGFADEVFRVFAARHPGVTLLTDNTSPAIDAMIRHVRGSVASL